MRIVYVAHSLLSRGGDRMVLAHLSHLAESGHEVAVRVNVIDTIFKIHPRISIERPSLPGKAGTILSALFERRSADVVLASIIPMACLLSFRNGAEVVNYAQDYNETWYSRASQKLLIRFLYRLGLSFFRIPTIAVSNDLAEDLRRRFHARVAVVENGVDTSIFYPDPDPGLVALKEGRKSVVLFSRGDYRKGLDAAYRVVQLAEERGAGPFEVWTVGEPALRPFGRITHRDFGYVQEERLRRIMSSADLFLYPTRFEGFGLMAAESFACGCPVVTTTAVPFAENGINAAVSDVDDVETMAEYVNRLLEDAEFSGALVQSGREAAAAMTLDSSVRKFEAALKAIMGQQAG